MTEESDIDRQDKELEQYLDGDTPPSRAYAELGEEMPPPDLDARILAAAEREVKVTGINAQRAPPFKAFAWAAIVVLSFSLVLNIIFDESVRDPIAELDGILKEERSSDAFEVLLDETQSPDALDNRQVKDELIQAQRVGEKVHRDQPAIAAEQAYNEIVVNARKRAAGEDEQPIRAMEVMSRERRAAAAAAPLASASLRQPPQDAFIRERIVEVLEGFTMEFEVTSRNEVRPIETDAGEFQVKAVAEPDPEVEIQDILEAFRARRDDEAFELLEAFRDTWPEHRLTTTLNERGL